MTGRLTTLQAAWVVARRDFTAILFSRSFFFFLLGPLFPVLVGAMAGGVGQRVQQAADRPELGVAMTAPDVARMQQARQSLAQVGGIALPELRLVRELQLGEPFDPRAALKSGSIKVSAVLSGTPEAPVLTGPKGAIEAWRGPVAMMGAQAAGTTPSSYPKVALAPVKQVAKGDKASRLLTAQAAQTLLFLLTMLLAGMVLSNLVEEKANKIIEILAAAIPMDALFFGKLFAMLAVSLVGIAVWGLFGLGVTLAAGPALPDFPPPAVGWPMFIGLGVVYFASAYLLLGSVFLAIGSLATTVREVQTLSMPVTMMQLMVFFLAGYAMTQPGSAVEWIALVVPFSSPYAMLARAAQDATLWTQAAAISWQVLWIVILVRLGARMFRTRVMKSGPARVNRPRKRLFARASTV